MGRIVIRTLHRILFRVVKSSEIRWGTELYGKNERRTGF